MEDKRRRRRIVRKAVDDTTPERKEFTERKERSFGNTTDYREKRDNNDRGDFKRKSNSRKRDSNRNFKDLQPKKEKPDYDYSKIAKGEKEEGIRLNRFIAHCGVCSRRDADKIIAEGRIKVNGKVVSEMGYKVNATDGVELDGKELQRERFTYVLLNKPKDFITTTEDPQGRRIVTDLIKDASTERLFPVGRLDRNTTGLLLLTNDGNLTEKLTHPRNEVKKLYQVLLDKPFEMEDFKQLQEGVELKDGLSKPDDLAYVGEKTILGIEIHSGKNRVVRRMFEHLGYEVIKLDRVVYAGLTKKDLPRGTWRHLEEKEVIRLKYLL